MKKKSKSEVDAQNATNENGTVNNQTVTSVNEAVDNQEQNNAPESVNAAETATVEGTAQDNVKNYLPTYSDEEKQHLDAVTKVVDEEILRVQDDERFNAIPFNNGDNCIINLKECREEGIVLVSPEVNRIHGKDQTTTGDSLMTDGAQHMAIVVTKAMADAANIGVVRFSNDEHKSDPIPDDALVLLDGNGRMNYLLEHDVKDWPNIFATFPSKNKAGLYNLPTVMNKINTQVSIWKTQDLVQKRIMEEGSKAHDGWKMINNLVRSGYKYQAACQIATLGTDRIKKDEVCKSGNEDTVFIHIESAKKIYAKAKEVFGNDESPLKTKAFTREISEQWQKLQKTNGDDKATEQYVDFLNGLTEKEIKGVLDAKAKSTDSGKVSKDAVRIGILHDAFFKYAGKKGLEI